MKFLANCYSHDFDILFTKGKSINLKIIVLLFWENTIAQTFLRNSRICYDNWSIYLLIFISYRLWFKNNWFLWNWIKLNCFLSFNWKEIWLFLHGSRWIFNFDKSESFNKKSFSITFLKLHTIFSSFPNRLIITKNLFPGKRKFTSFLETVITSSFFSRYDEFNFYSIYSH